MKRPLSELKYVVVHHTATPSDFNVDDIRRIHLQRGYSDVGYHFLVTEKGLKVGRWIGLRGAHAVPEKWPYTLHDMNRVGIGLSIIGNFAKEPPSDKVINEAAYAIKRVAGKYKIPLDRHHVIGHESVSYTLCPGPGVMEMIYEKLGI